MNLHLPLDILYPVTREVIRHTDPDTYLEKIATTRNATDESSEEFSHLTQDLITLLGYSDQDFTMFFEPLKIPAKRHEIFSEHTVALQFPYYQLEYYTQANHFRFDLAKLYTRSRHDIFSETIDQNRLSFNYPAPGTSFSSSLHSTAFYKSEFPLKIGYSSTTREVFSSEDKLKYHLSSYDSFFVITKRGTVCHLLSSKNKSNLFYWFDSKRITMFTNGKRTFDPRSVYYLDTFRKHVLNNYEPELKGKLLHSNAQTFYRCINNRLWLNVVEAQDEINKRDKSRQRRTLYHLKKGNISRAREIYYGIDDQDLIRTLKYYTDSSSFEIILQIIEGLKEIKSKEEIKEFITLTKSSTLRCIAGIYMQLISVKYSSPLFFKQLVEENHLDSLRMIDSFTLSLINSFEELKNIPIASVQELASCLNESGSCNYFYPQRLQNLYMRQKIISLGYPNLTPSPLDKQIYESY